MTAAERMPSPQGPAGPGNPSDMMPMKFTTVAHADHDLLSPLSMEKIARVIELMDLDPGARVLDVGCGKAELLIRLVERYGAHAVGIDPNRAFLAEARATARRRVPGADLAFHPVAMADYTAVPGSFDLACCLGATQAFGDLGSTLGALRALVRPGGQILIGEGYWRRPPGAGYLEVLEAEPEELSDHAGNVAAGEAAGLICLYSLAASEDEWDHYEGLYLRAVERWLAWHPEDPDAAPFRARIRRWRDAYLRWGRDTLGFGLYLFRRPA